MSNAQDSLQIIEQCDEDNHQKQSKNRVGDSGPAARFKEAHAKNIATVQNIVGGYCSSSEEEEELDEKSILSSLYKYYKTTTDEPQLLPKTSTFLENVLHSGAATCLICIGSVRRIDSIWSCRHCFCFFHLQCIRRWANDSIAQLKVQATQVHGHQGHYNHLGEYVPAKKTRPLHWCCPQCREEYNPTERPKDYKCFCRKEVNPQPQLWLVPHSCGNLCANMLQPECGHKCMLLCHPGPCPPCIQYTVASCLCGKSSAKPLRCIEKSWKCTQKCKELLPCGEHLCNQICHKPGLCPPCGSTRMQPCQCLKEVQQRNCSDLQWQCSKFCNKKYPCGIHNCKRICHSGFCGECPLGMPRTCPCGKSKKLGPCTEVNEPCGDTCQKLLSCGLHSCTQRCHRGDCNLCFVIVKTKCRCGMREKELPCCKDFTCDTKCKQIRDCGKHTCNRKCCDGHCPPCDKVCGKTLSCKKHKCQSICHGGPCYPCDRESQLKCRCGKTSKNVPCGQERTVRILCLEPCRIPSKCHHPSQHHCHKNDCPQCIQKCGLLNDNSGCGHICQAKCHAAVKVLKSINAAPTSVWKQHEKYEFKKIPHPQCEQKTSIMCLGGHKVEERPCWNSIPSSCGQKCNRLLRCGNHRCALPCHSVPDICDLEEQDGCSKCNENCNIPRPPGCLHPCARGCHLPPCYPCHINIKAKCHCGLTQVVYNCSDFFQTGETKEIRLDRQERLKSCGNRCLKNFSCGHRCSAICHSGDCPNPNLCRKKVRIYCKCKRMKSEVSCEKYRGGHNSIGCDENCSKTLVKIEEIRKQEAENMRLQEEAKNRLEVEQFEKKFSKRKHKERKLLVEASKNKINWKIVSIYVGTAMVIFGAVAVAFYEEN